MEVIVRVRRCSDEGLPIAAREDTFPFLVSARPNSESFNGFATVVDEHSGQLEVYQRVASKAVHTVATGKSDACVLVYGQTGAGKTRTVFGGPGFWRGRLNGPTPEDAASAGILPRSVGIIFKLLAEDSHRSTEIFISCVEIYQGQIRDLLFPDRKPRLLGDRAGSHSLVDTGWLRVETTIEFCDSVRRCASHRMTSATGGNSLSSRSHCFFYIKVGERTLTIVDLAGSERLTKHGGTRSPHRVSETKTINLSLSWLSHCFKAVSVGQKPPIRESALTRLLRGAIVGEQRLAVCLCITDRSRDVEETRGTLGFGRLVQLVGKRLQKRSVVEEEEHSNRSIDLATDESIEEYVSSKLLTTAKEDKPHNVANLQAYVKLLKQLCSGTQREYQRALRADVDVLREGIIIEEPEMDSEAPQTDSVFSIRNTADRILRRLKERPASRDPIDLLGEEIESGRNDATTSRVSNSLTSVVSLTRRGRTPLETARTRSTAADEKHCLTPCYELLSAG